MAFILIIASITFESLSIALPTESPPHLYLFTSDQKYSLPPRYPLMVGEGKNVVINVTQSSLALTASLLAELMMNVQDALVPI